MVSPDYYRTFGIQMVQGRAFTDEDRAGTPPVAIVNQAFVTKYLPDTDPLTERVAIARFTPGLTELGPPVEWQIVGVYRNVRNGGPRNDEFPEIDVPFRQSPWPAATVAVRTDVDLDSIRQSIAAVVHALDPDLPVTDLRTMDQIVHQTLAGDRFNALLFGSFAGVALVLAALGIYGVMSFTVAQRTHEIGLRMALGAERRQVVRLMLREGMATALAGAVLGSLGAYAVGRAMQGMWFGVGAIDPLAFGVVTLLLLGAAVVACLVPARRAASIDPMAALRQE
jgi:putative ABC transport system permease protein